MRYMPQGIFFLLFFVCNALGLQAGPLMFKPGDRASYVIYQTAEVDVDWVRVKRKLHAEAAIDVEIEILSSNPETGSYPFEVEVRLKRIQAVERAALVAFFYQHSTYSSYDSNQNENTEGTTRYPDRLLHSPLRFRVNGNFEVKEITNAIPKGDTDLEDEDDEEGLENFDESSSDPFSEENRLDFFENNLDFFDHNTSAQSINSTLDLYDNAVNDFDLGIFGATISTYENLLSQLFHFSGENLKEGNRTSVACQKFINWEDSPVNIKGMSVSDNGEYTIERVDQQTAAGFWKGTAIVTDHADFEGNVSVDGRVEWEIDHPLVQKRELITHINAKDQSKYFSYDIKVTVKQSWDPSCTDRKINLNQWP